MTCKRDRNILHPGILRRLRAAGCPLPSEDERNGITDLTIEVSRPKLTRCYALRAGAEYVFGLRITNHTYGSLVLQRFEGRMDWPAALIFPVDPRIYMPETQVYRLESGRKFPCADVLNHRVGERGTLEPGEKMEGILLAYSILYKIPKYYLQDLSISARLSVIDQYGRRHSSFIEILMDRTATLRPRTLVQSPRKGLFDMSEQKTSSIPAKTWPAPPAPSSGIGGSCALMSVPSQLRRGTQAEIGNDN